MKVARIEEVEDKTGMEVMKTELRRERIASLQQRLLEVKSGMDKGGYKIKNVLLGTMLLSLVLLFPIPTMAGVDVGISISLPPLIVFAGPPEVVVIPETNVYVIPDVDVDIFFYNGWWWRPWEGRWYRSRHYDSGWSYYRQVPPFHRRVPSGWRNDYREHRWRGHQWNYQRIPHQQVQRNWHTWEKSRHWEKQNTWGVQGLKPRTRSQQPSRAASPKSQAKPQVRKVQPQQSRPQSREVAKPQPSQQPQPREVQPQHSQPQHREAPQQAKPGNGKPERREEEKQDRK
jgi:hypothetical protein